jgi:kynurenine formamidase
MRWKTFIIGWSLALAALLFAARRTAAPPSQTLFSSVVDLTHTVDPHAASQSLAAGPFTGVITVDKNGFFERGMRVPQHFATSIEAPAASQPGRWTVDQIPTDHLLGPLVVLDVTAKSGGDPEVSLDDIALWEQVNGPVPAGAVVVARTGWEARQQARGRIPAEHDAARYAAWSPDAAKFLVEARSVYALGTDAPALDSGSSPGAPVSRYAAAHDVYALTNVANLGNAPHNGAVAVVAPTRIEHATSGPARVLALIRVPTYASAAN